MQLAGHRLSTLYSASVRYLSAASVRPVPTHLCVHAVRSCRKAMDWSEYGNSETQREHNLAAKGVSTGRLVSKHKGDRMIIICVLGGVTYAEIHQAAEIERRTGCTVLIGGSEVLTRSDYLDRLSMAVRETLASGSSPIEASCFPLPA